MEVEVEANLVFNRSIKLRVIDGSLLSGTLFVYESDNPYVLVFIFSIDEQTFLTEEEGSIRLDIFKDDLSRELKSWLEGKSL
jgi:hypothetical protein